ncbi:hypothetical protein CPB85DRAFT_1448036 [Mucidula mucida]|nr:hypothetical protein CPB85DRAFT_1448036 [Mucidula mucida]
MSNQPPAVQTFAEEKQFDGDSNWLAFKSQLLLAAGSAGVAGYIDGSIIKPLGLSAPFLSGTSTHVDKSDSAADIWAALIAKYDSSTEVGKTTAKNSLRAERFRDGDNFATFLKTMRRLRMEANHAGTKITNKDFRTIFLMAVMNCHIFTLLHLIISYQGPCLINQRTVSSSVSSSIILLFITEAVLMSDTRLIHG